MISKDDKALIKQFVSNKPLMDAVRRVMTKRIYEQGGVENSTTNFVFGFDMSNLDDATYGQKVKVIVQALLELETAYKTMVAEVAEPAKPVSPDNEAR